MSQDFAGLTAVVTGAGSGIGLEVVKGLNAQGATIFGLDIQEGAMSKYATYIKCDVGSSESVKAAFQEISGTTSVIDVLVNNAGIGAIGTVEDATEDEWVRVLNINVIGMGRISQAAMPYLKKSKCGAIVNTCSLVATAGVPKRAVYSASKGAVYALTLAMAADAMADGIRVNCVNPGTADTPWVKNLLSQAADPEKEITALRARQPLGRLISPVEVASAIIYLANPAQASTTGTALAVDGGVQGMRLPK
jgi:NAD(P)-dependent dehydrogenase (short-subunit alcohol dehydrogenase family)